MGQRGLGTCTKEDSKHRHTDGDMHTETYRQRQTETDRGVPLAHDGVVFEAVDGGVDSALVARHLVCVCV